ncbi:MAG: hypothetical protein K8T90_02080 [Planctomycetes bacterium]|nr:hypothetical protein [Planctomycetota bacterium]
MHPTDRRTPSVTTPARRDLSRRAAGSSRLAVVLIAVAVLGTTAALAVPRFLAPSLESAAGSAAATGPAAAMVPVVVQAAANGQAAGAVPAPEVVPNPAQIEPRVVTTSADGDLVVELELRWPSALSGTSVPATVHFVNTSLKPFHLPAPGEPHPTLSIVVLDGGGNEVRRVVESGPDPYPRRTTLVASGASMDLPALVVGTADLALPPGEYTVHAELRADPVWARLGLPMWKGPNGPARSLQMPLTITAKP